MEAARIARIRGHDVSIWERDEQLGGKLEVAGLAPSKREVLRFRDHQSNRLARARRRHPPERRGHARRRRRRGARRRHRGHRRRADRPADPGHRRRDGPRRAAAPARRRLVAAGERVVVIGGSATGCETAEHLTGEGAEVTIIEMRPSVGFGIEAITRRHLIRELKRSGVKVLTERQGDHDRGRPRALRGRRRDPLGPRRPRRARARLPARPATRWRSRSPGPRSSSSATPRAPPTSSSAINAGADAGLAV